MLYALFLALAIIYNWRKFGKERAVLLKSLLDAQSSAHRKMILSHYFHVFIFEGFLAILVAHLISERALAIGLVGLGGVYLILLTIGLGIYQYVLNYFEKKTGLTLRKSFNHHLIKDFRVSFAIIMLPILLYSIINWTFQDGVFEDWGNYWFIGIMTNIIFVSVLTLVCTVIIMLKLIPNREITEPEYLEIINKRLAQIQMPHMRVRWIETDIKNAFVVGLKLLRFSNQTMFLGRSLRTTLTLQEFDAVVAHELSHAANRHAHKRLIELLKNFVTVIFGVLLLTVMVIGFSFLFLGDEANLYSGNTALVCVVVCLTWMLFNYALFFDTIRSHEFEADAYSVLNMGIDFEHLKSSLEKLTAPEELPDYLVHLKKKKEKKGLALLVARLFSTHPEVSERLHSLQYKMNEGLPYNYYVSPARKIKTHLAHFFNWKVLTPLTFSFIGFCLWATLDYQQGKKMITFIAKSSREEILGNPQLLKSINDKPLLIGKSLMYFVVKKKDSVLVNYFLRQGANKGKTLVYLAETKDFSLFQKHYEELDEALTEDEYFLVLRKSAEINFTAGYRYLVNSERFEALNPDYKKDIAWLHHSKGNRSPASVSE